MAAQADNISLWEAAERGTGSVCGSVNGVAWLLEEQQELLVLAPLRWEESLDICNCWARLWLYSMAQTDNIALYDAAGRGSDSVFGAVNGVARQLESSRSF